MPSKTASKAVTTPAEKTGLGTFGGVFTPSLLTILGVIMYLRFGWVVGSVGLFGTWLIVTMAVSITLSTDKALSLRSGIVELMCGGEVCTPMVR